MRFLFAATLGAGMYAASLAAAATVPASGASSAPVELTLTASVKPNFATTFTSWSFTFTDANGDEKLNLNEVPGGTFSGIIQLKTARSFSILNDIPGIVDISTGSATSDGSTPAWHFLEPGQGGGNARASAFTYVIGGGGDLDPPGIIPLPAPALLLLGGLAGLGLLRRRTG